MVDKINVGFSNQGVPEGQAEHDAKMAQLADDQATQLSMKNKDEDPVVLEPNGGEAPAADASVRPDNVPEKFWDAEKGEVNVEALLKSQQDGEAALREGKPEPKDEPKDDAEGDDKVAPESAKVIESASKEFAEKGELSADMYANLEKAGMPKVMVDEYIAGQMAMVERLEGAAAEPFGSFDGYNDAANWAAENLSQEEIAALDVQLTSTNPAIVKQGAAALQSKYAANADITPDTTLTGQGNPSTGSAFKSSAEMQAAMSDPRYKVDAAYRKEVEGKIARSNANLFDQ